MNSNDKTMKKRVYGVSGVSCRMANHNSDFSGYPKSTPSGRIYGSDKAFKYPIKKLWQEKGEKVLFIKSNIIKKNKLSVASLEERYEQVTGKKIGDDRLQLMQDILKMPDCKNFGATVATSKCNIAITGAVQIGQGYNLYADTEVVEQPILSPFRNANKEEAEASTIGTKITVDEAHYFYPFAINPLAYTEYVDLGVTEGYTTEDYNMFKDAALTATTAYASNAKAGCENEFALFVETTPDLYLPDLTKYITFTKKDGKNEIAFSCTNLLTDNADRILNVEVYYDPYTTIVKGLDFADIKYFNIHTLKAV